MKKIISILVMTASLSSIAARNEDDALGGAMIGATALTGLIYGSAYLNEKSSHEKYLKLLKELSLRADETALESLKAASELTQLYSGIIAVKSETALRLEEALPEANRLRDQLRQLEIKARKIEAESAESLAFYLRRPFNKGSLDFFGTIGRFIKKIAMVGSPAYGYSESKPYFLDFDLKASKNKERADDAERLLKYMNEIPTAIKKAEALSENARKEAENAATLAEQMPKITEAITATTSHADLGILLLKANNLKSELAKSLEQTDNFTKEANKLLEKFKDIAEIRDYAVNVSKEHAKTKEQLSKAEFLLNFSTSS